MPETTDGGGEPREGQTAYAPSHLFLVRLWSDTGATWDAVWCGKVQHVTRGGARQFRDWPALVAVLRAMLPAASPVPPPRE
ncbi:MAG TPA: hypothetical protein VM536_13000 [Chloroflexia bacterium]|nr:hypothetical protein [Chloroflexia bacterium]